MFGWLRELLDIRNEQRDRKLMCPSCEVLKEQLTRANYEKDQLLRELLRDEVETEMKPAVVPEPLKPKHIPWRVRQQQLEAEDRKQAQVLAEFKKTLKEANQKIDTGALESSIGIGVVEDGPIPADTRKEKEG